MAEKFPKKPEQQARIDAGERFITEVIRAGHGGVLPCGRLVDRRKQPEALLAQKELTYEHSRTERGAGMKFKKQVRLFLRAVRSWFWLPCADTISEKQKIRQKAEENTLADRLQAALDLQNRITQKRKEELEESISEWKKRQSVHPHN